MLMRTLSLGLLLAAALVFGALVAAGCGQQQSNLLPVKRAARLTTTVDAIKQASDRSDCSGASYQLMHAKALVAGLPSSVDGKLVGNLRDWLNHIESRLSIECKKVAAKPQVVPDEGAPEEEVVPPKEKDPKPAQDDSSTTTPATPETPAKPETPQETGGAQAETTPPPATTTPPQ